MHHRRVNKYVLTLMPRYLLFVSRIDIHYVCSVIKKHDGIQGSWNTKICHIRKYAFGRGVNNVCTSHLLGYATFVSFCIHLYSKWSWIWLTFHCDLPNVWEIWERKAINTMICNSKISGLKS